MRSGLIRLLAVARKETREILRDPVTLWIAIVLPVLMMYLFSYAITLDVRNVTLAVADEDGTPESREYVAAFLHSGYFRLHAAPPSAGGLDALLDRGEVRMALTIPSGFAHDLRQGLTARVQTLLDGSFPNTALVALGYADAITQSYEARLRRQSARARLGSLPADAAPIRLESRVRYNPALRSENYIIPGLFAVILLAFPPLLTALAVVREREQGSIEQLYASPIRAWELFWGKLLPYALIAFLEMLLLLGAAVLWFQVPVRGSVPLLLGLSLLYVLASCGIGLVVSTWTRSQVVALLLAVVLTFMPALLFSGFMFAIESMPAAFRVYTYLFPARYFTEISRGIVLRGSGARMLWPEASLLAAYTLALFALAAVRFRKRIG